MKIPKKIGKLHLVPILCLQNVILVKNSSKMLLALWMYLHHDVKKKKNKHLGLLKLYCQEISSKAKNICRWALRVNLHSHVILLEGNVAQVWVPVTLPSVQCLEVRNISLNWNVSFLIRSKNENWQSCFFSRAFYCCPL